MIDGLCIQKRAVTTKLRETSAVVIQRRQHRRATGFGVFAPLPFRFVFGQGVHNALGVLHNAKRVLNLQTQRGRVGHVAKAFHIVKKTLPVCGKLNLHLVLPSSAIPSGGVPAPRLP